MTARLSGNCPSAIVADEYTIVVVPYEYTVIVEAGADAALIVHEMENTLHRSLMSDKCTEGSSERRLQRRRKLQDDATVAYQGFNSNPSDQLSAKGCAKPITITDGQECHLVSGGVTAVVLSDVDDGATTLDVWSFVSSVLVDPAVYEALGVSSVVMTDVTEDATAGEDAVTVDSSEGGVTNVVAEDGTAYDGTAEDSTEEEITEGAEEDSDVEDTTEEDATAENPTQDLSVDGAKVGSANSAEDPAASKPSGLTTTGTIVIVVIAVTVLALLVAFIAVRIRKRNQLSTADANVMFSEFSDDPERPYSSTNSPGYNESFAPLGTKMNNARPPPPAVPPPGSRSSSRGSRGSRSSQPAAVILNEQDDVSLFSKESMLGKFKKTGSVGSAGSKGSNSSKKSVEFVRAGQSFDTRKSNQPEDTVDL